MENKKKLSEFCFWIIVTILWLTVLTVDGSRLLLYSKALNSMESLLSKSLKLLLSFVVTLFVWTRESNSNISQRDRVFQRVIFLLFFIAEIFFYINNNYIGIVLFSIAQIVLTIRNSSGLLNFIKSKDIIKKIPTIFITAFVVVFITIILLLKILLPNSSNPLFIIMMVYSVLLLVSTVVGLLTPMIGYFPPLNSSFIVAGAVTFYIGDITVGLNLILPEGINYIIFSTLTWFFYLPALIFIALSGLKNEVTVSKKKSIDN